MHPRLNDVTKLVCSFPRSRCNIVASISRTHLCDEVPTPSGGVLNGRPELVPTVSRCVIFTIFALLIALFAIPSALDAQVNVRGYFRRDGTYVQPHVRTAPDGNPYNNYSFPGNYNPNSGEITLGDPHTYLERYYRTRGRAPANVSTDRGQQWAAGELSRLPRLPDHVPEAEFFRARAYCTWLYGESLTRKNACEVEQYRALTAVALPDYRLLPAAEVARGARYCEWLFGDNRAAFYDCINRQLFGISRTSESFTGVDTDEAARARAYCEWLYGDDRASFQLCTAGQATVLRRRSGSSTDLPPGEWARAERYCEWLYGDDRASARTCLDHQGNGIRQNLRLETAELPRTEWQRATDYCEWLYGDDRASALSCRREQASGIRSAVRYGLASGRVSAETARYCEWLYGDNRSSYWSCVRSRR
jgi:hypothetical protein